MKNPILSSHDMNFVDIIENTMKRAFENEKFNRTKSSIGTKGTGRNKKSPVQNGNAAVSCLLQYVVFESMLRRKYYLTSEVNRPLAYKNNNLWHIYGVLNPKATADQELHDFFEEITLIRHTVAHAYLFEGVIEFNDEYEIVGISEKAVGGRDKDKLRRRLTPKLKLHASPNQISFKDAAVFYQATNVLLKLAKMDISHAYWKWDKTGEELEPEDWLIRAMKNLGYGSGKTWKTLEQLLVQANYGDFLTGLADETFEDWAV